MPLDLLHKREEIWEKIKAEVDVGALKCPSPSFIRRVKDAINQLTDLASQMDTTHFSAMERSRTLRLLGNFYTYLGTEEDRSFYKKAQRLYQQAEDLFQGVNNPLEKANLDFVIGKNLILVDGQNLENIQNAKKRLSSARTTYSTLAPQWVHDVDTLLQVVHLKLQTILFTLKLNRDQQEMEDLNQELVSGNTPTKTAEKMLEVMTRDGGMPGLLTNVLGIVNTLPPDYKKHELYRTLQTQMGDLTKLALEMGSENKEESNILARLQDKLDESLAQEYVSQERADSLKGILEQAGGILSRDTPPTERGKATISELKEEVKNLRGIHHKLREQIGNNVDILHYPSHGIDRPPRGSRAAELVERCWKLRRYLFDEIRQTGKGQEEAREGYELNIRSTKIDRRIYEAGANDSVAMTIDMEELRPFALSVRAFSRRNHPMIVQPLWPGSSFSAAIDCSAVFYSGGSSLRRRLAPICKKLGLSLMKTPSGQAFASARWNQLQKAMTTIFDLGMDDGPQRAAVAYELGIALTLGKPVVVVTTRDYSLPFDIDVPPILLTQTSDTTRDLAEALEKSLTWTYPQTSKNDGLETVRHLVSSYPRPHPNEYVDQTLKALITQQHREIDSTDLDRTLLQFVNFLQDGRTMLIHPIWSPVYPNPGSQRLFHVMPFRPKWADKVKETTQKICTRCRVEYRRGDDVSSPHVIRSIWQEIGQASHILIDLTGFNANVALELGIAHTLGKTCLMVGQKETIDQLFPMIAKLRFYPYRGVKSLGGLVWKFLS